jgi:hypothetical protein
LPPIWEGEAQWELVALVDHLLEDIDLLVGYDALKKIC